MITLDTSQTMVAQAVLKELGEMLKPEIEAMNKVVEAGGYSDDRASLNLPDDADLLSTVKDAAKSFEGADTVVLVGMGGPGLGAKAAQEALQGTLHNEVVQARSSFTPPDGGVASDHFASVPGARSRIFYADTVDGSRWHDLLKILDTDLAAKKKVVAIVATQSGTTTESIVGLTQLAALFGKYNVDLPSALLVITNEGSKLDAVARSYKLTRVLVPPKVGGRYSVFSALGLFPLHLMGIDIDALQAGAREARDEGLELPLEGNSAAASAATIYHHYQQGRHMLVNFMLEPDYESVGLWLRQVMAESLGKAHDRDGKEVHVGITPTVAVGSRDLHSMFQSYMEGPDDKYTVFIRSDGRADATVPTTTDFEALTPNLPGKRHQQISHAINEGVLAAYREQHRPFAVVNLGSDHVRALGSLMQAAMMETMFLGHLLNVNPFDQPGVELYKHETKRILAEG